MDEYPILNLPEEVWDIILGLLDDSKDILATTTAFPELDGVLKRKRCLWLFAEAFPALFRHLPAKLTLRCRLVCRRWSRAVDNFLESHPSLTPYKHGDKQLWHLLVNPQWRQLRFRKVSFKSQVKLGKFLEATKEHSGERNPFIGRAIKIEPFDGVYDEEGEDGHEDDLSLEPFWRQATDLLFKFGKHVWYIEIHPFLDQIPVNFCSSVVECLGYLPNLKKLVIVDDTAEFETEFGDHGESPLKDYFVSRENSIPPLRSSPTGLETLLCQGIVHSLVRTLVGWYSPQLRKLSIELGFWNREYSKQLILPNLTELSVTDAIDLAVLVDLLMTIEAPQLVRLEINYENDNTDPIVIGRDIFPWLQRFPHILHLCFLSSDAPFMESASMTNDPVPSLKSLIITDEAYLGYSFLSSFPNLECLFISEWKGEDLDEDAQPPGIFRQALYDLEDGEMNALIATGIWEYLPKLKRVTLDKYDEDGDDEDDNQVKTYTRDIHKRQK